MTSAGIEETVDPQVFQGYKAKVILCDDRVEIHRGLTARIGGARDAIVLLRDLVSLISKPPTSWVNGWVYLVTNPDPDHLRYWADPPKWKIGGNRQVILFGLHQRATQAAFLAALDEARHAQNRDD